MIQSSKITTSSGIFEINRVGDKFSVTRFFKGKQKVYRMIFSTYSKASRFVNNVERSSKRAKLVWERIKELGETFADAMFNICNPEKINVLPAPGGVLNPYAVLPTNGRKNWTGD